MTLDLKFKTNLTDEQLISIVSNNLQESNESTIFYVAGFDKDETQEERNENNEIVYFSKCIFVIFCIPKNLIAKLMEQKMNQCYFYIATYLDSEKFLIMNKPPKFEDISRINSNGVEMPYQTSLLTFKLS